MKSSSIHCALGVAVCIAPGFSTAQSSVTIYGIVDVTARYANDATSTWRANVGNGGVTGSRFGIRASENLAGGAKAFVGLEAGFDPSTGQSLQATSTQDFGQAAVPEGRIFGREALVGLSHPVYGTLIVGRQATLAHQVSSRFQPLSNPNLEPKSVFSVHHIARQDNIVKYLNQFGPIGLGASVTVSEGNGGVWAASGSYTAGGVDVVSYVQRMQNAAGTETRNIYGAGGSYVVTGSVKAFAGYMLRTQRVSTRQNRVWTIGANYSVGKWVLTPVFIRDSQKSFGTTAPGSRSMLSLSADYFFTKRTDIYFDVDRNHVSGGYTLPIFMARAGTATGTMVGVRHRF